MSAVIAQGETMPKVIHTSSAVRRVKPSQELELQITLGHAQTGQWWVKSEAVMVAQGSDGATIKLGPAAPFIGKVLQVEVRCDDTNPNTDELRTTIELRPVDPVLTWVTDNDGHQSPHGSMTSFIDIFIRKVI